MDDSQFPRQAESRRARKLADNRRRNMRFPPEEQDRELALWTSHRATALDESYGGIGVLLTGEVHLAIGDHVGLKYRGLWTQALVVNVQRLDNGQVRAGLKWV